MCDSLGSGPLLDGSNFPTLQTHTPTINNMPKKIHTLKEQMALTFLDKKLVFIK